MKLRTSFLAITLLMGACLSRFPAAAAERQNSNDAPPPKLSSEDRKRLRDRIGEIEKSLKELKNKVDSGRLTPEDERILDGFVRAQRGPVRRGMDGPGNGQPYGRQPFRPPVEGGFDRQRGPAFNSRPPQQDFRPDDHSFPRADESEFRSPPPPERSGGERPEMPFERRGARGPSLDRNLPPPPFMQDGPRSHFNQRPQMSPPMGQEMRPPGRNSQYSYDGQRSRPEPGRDAPQGDFDERRPPGRNGNQ